MDQSRRSEDQGAAKGAVARVRVAVKTTHESMELAPNDTLSLIWQAFCVLEGSPAGLDVIDHTTRSIRAPLLKRFCRFLENNAIDMDHVSSVERLLQREAPHMDWKPVVPGMLAKGAGEGNKNESKHSVAELKVSRDSRFNTTALAPVSSNYQSTDNSGETRDHTGRRENPIDLIEIQDGTCQEHARQVAHEPSKKKSTLSWTEATPESDQGTQDPIGQDTRTDNGKHLDSSARPSGNEGQSSKAARKGGMRVDHSHIKLLNLKPATKPKSTPSTQQAKRGNSSSSPCDSYKVSVPTEAELRGDDLHAWPSLGKELRFIFQPTLWPAFCKTESFRLPQCFLPGYGFGLIDSSTNTIRIALVLRFFRFLKRREDQATMIRALRALNKLLLTESLARGLDWEVIALEKVKPLLKIIGVSSLDDASGHVAAAAPASADFQERMVENKATSSNQMDVNSILTMNRNLTYVGVAPADVARQAASNETQMQLLQLQQQLGQSNGTAVRPKKIDQQPSSNFGLHSRSAIEPLANRDRSPEYRGRNVAGFREDTSEQSDLKSKCMKVLHSVEDLINAMESEHDKRSFCKPGRHAETNADEQQHYKMVAASLEELTQKANLLLDDDSRSEPNPMANTLIMLKSSVEALSSKLDAVSESLQSQSNRAAPSRSSLDLSRSTAPMHRTHWSSFDHDDEQQTVTAIDIDSARKRAILSHAAAERDRLKRQRMG